MIDLHIHTDASDGSLRPSAVVKLAIEMGLEAIGITDHDSVDGTGEFLEHCRRGGIEGVSGIEIGVGNKSGPMHLLGYFVDPESAGLRSLIDRVRSDRIVRAKKVIEKLNDNGIDLDISDVQNEAGGSPPGRPHVAMALRNRGFVPSVQEAFSRFLAEGKEAYVERYKPAFDEAVTVITEAGGIPVIAHPVSLGLVRNEMFLFLKNLVDRGLGGIEVYHPTQGGDLRKELTDMAVKLSILITGGSDFHGEVRPDWKMGVGLGDISIPYDVLDTMKKRREAAGD
jgi:predicted metal-dependent phosphoesterase TrpH